MKYILISGKANSGKTYLGMLIKQKLEKNNKRVLQTEFSKYLKVYAKEILNYDGKRENKPRKFLQNTGSFIREDLNDEDFFVRRTLEDARIYEQYFDIIIISDVRLINEINKMKMSKYEVTTIKVINKYGEYDLDELEKNHITEKELEDYNDFDYIIENSSLDDLELSSEEIVKEVC